MFTKLEEKITTLMCRGESIDIIAEKMELSTCDVLRCLKEAMNKAEVDDFLGLVIFSYQRGLVEPLEKRL